MITIFFGFVTVLLATFTVIFAVMAPPASHQVIARRMEMIHIPVAIKESGNQDVEQLLKAGKKTRFSGIEGFLERYSFSRTLRLHILQAHSSATVTTLLLGSASLLVAGYGLAFLFAPLWLIDLGVGVALAFLPFGLLAYKRAKRVNAFNAQLAECIDMLARSLRAGHSVAGALEMLAENAQEPAASEFGEVSKQQNLGLPLRDALLQLLERVPSTDLRVLITAILVQKETGGNLVEVLDRAVFVIRERLRIEGEVRVQTAQGRLTGWILTALPVVMMVMLNLVNPGYSSILFQDPMGRKLIYCGLGMLTAGALIIRHIVNGIEV